MQSETIGALAKALATAQAQMTNPTKGRTATIKSDKATYAYNYADLPTVIECYRKPLADNHLALVQTMRADEGHLVLSTVLMHESGEWIASEYPMQSFQRAQEQGSAITYARRYTVTALLGIAAEDDDDGAAATEGTPKESASVAPSGDAGVILDIAAELEQLTGKPAAEIVREASKFTKDGKEHSFSDPRSQRSEKWLKTTRERLEREMQKKGATAAVGEERIPF